MVVPISVEEQEVMCYNCYDTVKMNSVDSHSSLCFRRDPSWRPSRAESGIKAGDIADDRE